MYHSPSLICCIDVRNSCLTVSVWLLINLSHPHRDMRQMSGEHFGCPCWVGVWECHWHLMCEVQGCCYMSDSYKTVSAAHSSHQQKIIQPKCQWHWGQKPWLHSSFFALPFWSYSQVCEGSLHCFSAFYLVQQDLSRRMPSPHPLMTLTTVGKATWRSPLHCWLFST